MKRSRDENCSPVKRLFASSCGESHRQAHNSGVRNRGPRPTTDDALLYLRRVREQFQNQQETYEQFLNVMKEFKAQRITTDGVVAIVKDLFKGHNQLLYEFNAFLPEGYDITLDDDDQVPRRVEFHVALNFVSKTKNRLGDDTDAYKAFIHILSMYRDGNMDGHEVYEQMTEVLKGHQDLFTDFITFLPEVAVAACEQNAQHDRSSFHHYDDRRPQMYPSRPLLLHNKRWQQDRVYSSPAEREVTADHPDLGEKRATTKKREESEYDNPRNFVGQYISDKRRQESFTVPSSNEKSLKKMYAHEFTFCERVKEKMGHLSDYQAFLKCLNLYSQEIITRAELQGLVSDLLGKHPDLMEGFNEFLERCENIDGFLEGVMRKKSLWIDGNLRRSAKVDEKYKEAKRETDGAKDKEKYCKSIQDLDLSNCQSCTPSYRLLPDDYPVRTASHRSILGAQVLNDHWVSVTSGSEDYSFKHMRRNQYEESLFKCEDDRFELDMLLESVISTAKRAEEILNNIRANKINMDSSICIEDQFTALHIRCIERLYGDHGLDVTDLLRKNPASTLPVLLTRLKQKQHEWTKTRADLNKVWSGVYAKNHYKSLDHRSFYFKQQDSKNLSTKSLVAEIKERKESIEEDDILLLSVAAAYKRSLVPHLELHYPDIGLHEDIRHIIKFACNEICSTKEQSIKLMRLWSTFVEKILGVSCQTIAANGNTSARRRDSLESHKTHKDNVLSGDRAAKESDIVGTIEKVPVFRVESSSGTKPSVQGLTKTSGDNHNPKPVSLRLKATVISNPLTARNDKKSAKNSKCEKEDCELSPIGFEKGNSAVTGDFMLAPEEKPCQNGIGEDAKNDAGAGDEDNENASEGGSDTSSSEFGEGDCSRDENYDEDDVENDDVDGKNESESEGHVYLNKVKPLMKYVSSAIGDADRNDSRVFYGNDDFYVLFRLHQTLYERILTAKTSSRTSDSKWKNSKDSSSSDPYASFMSSLFNLLDGSCVNTKFEDDCRAIIGNQAYVVFTLDKLIFKLVKHLQTIIADETDNKLLELFEYEKSRKYGEFLDTVYHDNACVLLHDENLYRFECSSMPARLSIQLMHSVSEKANMIAVSLEPKFSSYVDNDLLSLGANRKFSNKVLLRRNKRKYAGLDKASALDLATKGVKQFNGLEYKIRWRNSKILYVLDTEDYFIRPSKRTRRSPSNPNPNQTRVQRFHKLLSSSASRP